MFYENRYGVWDVSLCEMARMGDKQTTYSLAISCDNADSGKWGTPPQFLKEVQYIVY